MINTDTLDYSLFNNEKTCVMITGFNRPDYMKQVVESINNCDELENIPIYIFLDGGYNSKQKENALECSKIKFKNKFLDLRKYNYGCERNVLNAIYFLFEQCKFKNIFILEDDLVLCKNYFKFVFDEYKKIKLKDNTAGLFQGWNKCLLSKEEKKHNLFNYAIDTDEHLWGYLLTSDTWSQIKKIIDKYHNIINSTNCREGFKTVLENNLYPSICNLYIKLIEEYNISNPNILKRYINTQINPGQDEIISFSMKCLSLKRYFPVVNRCLYIGKIGLHSTERDYNNLHLNEVILDIY